MNEQRAVIGTNSWGSATYEKIIRGSVVDHNTLKEAMRTAVNKGIVPICGCRKPFQVEQLGTAANTRLSEAEMKKLEEVADELNVKVLGQDMFRFAVRK